RGVHLDDVHRRRVGDRDTRLADPARLDGRPVDAVQTAGEDLRHRRLAGPARADEQVRVMDLAVLDGVAKRWHDVLLADDVGEGAGAVAEVERGSGGHGWPVYPRSATGLPGRPHG